MEYSGSCSLSNRASQGHTCIGTLQLPELPRFTAYETSCNVISLGGWYSCHGLLALQFTQHLVYGATGSRNGYLWTSACLAWGTNKEVWYEVTLSFEIFDFRKIFSLLCIFATELCVSPTSRTPSRHLNLIQIPLHLAAFRLFFDLYGFWPWLFSLPPLAHSLGTGCLSAVSEEKKDSRATATLPSPTPPLLQNFLTFWELLFSFFFYSLILHGSSFRQTWASGELKKQSLYLDGDTKRSK